MFKVCKLICHFLFSSLFTSFRDQFVFVSAEKIGFDCWVGNCIVFVEQRLAITTVMPTSFRFDLPFVPIFFSFGKLIRSCFDCFFVAFRQCLDCLFVLCSHICFTLCDMLAI